MVAVELELGIESPPATGEFRGHDLVRVGTFATGTFFGVVVVATIESMGQR